MIEFNIIEIEKDFKEEIVGVGNLSFLDELRVKYLGKKGIVTSLMQELASLSNEEKREFGAKVNELKNGINDSLQQKKEELELVELNRKLVTEQVDITLPCREEEQGSIHLLTKVAKELENIFAGMGFSTISGPQIEDDYHCFEALNFPPDHPARQMQDTFYLPEVENGEKMLLRTHTSSVQIREMKAGKPPFKFIVPCGRVFRCDYDATHAPMFNQIEGVYVDKGVNMGHLKGCLHEFLTKFFEVDDVSMLLRPSFFPFTEPSAEVDIKCSKQNGIIKIGEGEDLLEILGCGMIHPNVLKNVGIDPNEYQGFAFGTGLDRLAMLKYGANDIRKFFEPDIRWIQHFGFRFFQ